MPGSGDVWRDDVDAGDMETEKIRRGQGHPEVFGMDEPGHLFIDAPPRGGFDRAQGHPRALCRD